MTLTTEQQDEEREIFMVGMIVGSVIGLILGAFFTSLVWMLEMGMI